MDCRMAGVLMMKYMDSVLTENEARLLSIHVSDCASCREDFVIYADLTEEFERHQLCVFDAPDGFELRVMESVYGIEPNYGAVHSQDAVVGFVFGAFSILFGAGVILSVYSAEIMTLASEYPYIGMLMEGAAGASEVAASLVNGISHKISYYFNGIYALIDAAKYGILAIVAALVTVQIFIHSKNKVEV